MSNDLRPEKLDTITHLGAGYCREIESHLAAAAERIVLAEANPAIAQDLRRRFESEPKVAVMDAAVAGKGGAQVLHIFNYSGVSSLRAPKDLTKLFPGLRLLEEAPVDAIAADAFIRQLSLTDDKKNGLVIDTPGEEAAILAALVGAGLAALFSQITVHCARAPLYEGGKDVEAIEAILVEAGFEAETGGDDPDRPVIEARPNPMFREHQRANRFEEKLRESMYRQSLVDEELKRVEAQLDIVREILIREKIV